MDPSSTKLGIIFNTTDFFNHSNRDAKRVKLGNIEESKKGKLRAAKFSYEINCCSFLT